jgi:hypothetical protein
MKRVLTIAAAVLAAGLMLKPDDASARWGGGGFRGGGFHGGGFRGFHGGGFRGAAFRGGGWGWRGGGWGWRHRGWGWGGGALAAGALIGVAAASSYPYGYYGGYYPAYYGGCGSRLTWVWTPYGYRRAWVAGC